MKKVFLIFVILLFFTTLLHAAEHNPNTPSKNLPQRMKEILPYAVDQTVQTYSKTVHGGVQHLVAKSADDTLQIKLIRDHLRKMAEQFRNGDFSLPERLHGADMPGLAQLKLAKPDDIRFDYKPLEKGGQIHYSSEYPQFVGALHEWIDAQNSEHGNPVLPGHAQHHSTTAE
ncbi:aspartate carbamoyltransferase [Methylomonas sp. LL1]|uniref:aspartate carbamoyltransferase n=1 Tax=Methylomonas sp. LL1 TaxID=2785785 RepID=UPI0018C37A93|nr:aspartate carbamoyltransferase [Methylomonas sp. LL1]QPK63807.1 aspartate carbamoyltransferase [Methylomonas sp. LL1]